MHPGTAGSGSERFDSSPGAVAKSLLGKFTMRKASILSISSIGSFNADRKSNSSTEELYPNSNKSKFLRSIFSKNCKKYLHQLISNQEIN